MREVLAAGHRHRERDPDTGRFVAADADEARPSPPTARAYDGGVRMTTPRPGDPEREHAELILGLVTVRRAIGGGEAVIAG